MTDLLSQLPEFHPHPDLWARISADLDGDDALARAVGDLPHYEPKTDLWLAIDGQLTRSPDPAVVPADRPVVRPLWPGVRLLWAITAVAAAVVLVGTWLLVRPAGTETIRMEYAVEQPAQLPGAGDAPALSAADQRAEAFIQQQCEEQERICQRPDIHELRHQLARLTTDQQRVAQERLTFGDDPVLVQAQVKIENQRAEITKELISLLRS